MNATNRELLLQIADVIENHPDKYRQNIWTNHPNLKVTLQDGRSIAMVFDAVAYPEIERSKIAECGTRACIAGWAIHLTPHEWRPRTHNVMWMARDLLGLTDEEAEILFSATFMNGSSNRQVAARLRRIADGDWADGDWSNPLESEVHA